MKTKLGNFTSYTPQKVENRINKLRERASVVNNPEIFTFDENTKELSVNFGYRIGHVRVVPVFKKDIPQLEHDIIVFQAYVGERPQLPITELTNFELASDEAAVNRIILSDDQCINDTHF